MTLVHDAAVAQPSAVALKVELQKLQDARRPRWSRTILGFGVTTAGLSLDRERGNCSARVESHLDAVMSVDVHCSVGDSDVGTLRAAAERVPFEVTVRPGALEVKVAHAEVVKRADDARAAKLGPLREAAVPAELRAAYDRLEREYGMMAVGHHCNLAGTGPDGATDLGLLVAANRADLLRNLLRGKGPIARVLAAQALRELGAVDALDRAAITAIEDDDAEVMSCGGCMYRVSSARALLESQVAAP